jgi:hypothetical protein
VVTEQGWARRHQEGLKTITYLLGGDGLLARLAELLDGLVVVTEILLAANQDDGETLAEVQDLRDPLEEQVSAYD